MATSLPRRVYTKDDSQTGYDSDFEPELDKKYQCPICLAALRDPVQTKCGHRFCKSCLKGVYGHMRFSRCPADNTWFDTQRDVFGDNAVKREVMSLTVRCKNTSGGCDWKAELREEEDHKKVCPFERVSCGNDSCPEKDIIRRDLQSHLVTCPRRLECCQHCGVEVVVADITKHQLMKCMKFPVSCHICADTGILREDIPRHIDPVEGDCPLVTIPCAFANIGCQHMDKRKNINAHYAEAGHHHMVLVTNQIQGQESKLRLTERELEATKDRSIRLFRQYEQQSVMLERQQVILNSQAELISHLETTSYNGKLLWKITLPQDNQCRITSPSFYTGRPGYKVCVAIELAGYRENNDMYTSLFVILEKGLNDGQLKFPFDGNCNVTVFDQSETAGERQNLSINVLCHQVPRATTAEHRNVSKRGRLKVMPTNEFLKGRFVKNDVIFIQVDVSHCIPPEIVVPSVGSKS